MQVYCSRCKNTWEYNGEKESTKDVPAYVSCTTCRKNIKLPVKGS